MLKIIQMVTVVSAGFTIPVMGRGFTLLELVLVLVILGVLAAVAVPRLSLNTGLEARSAATDLVVALRGAQLHAMNGVPGVVMGVDGAGWSATSEGDELRLPGGLGQGEWPGSVAVTLGGCAPGRLGFDGLGRPECDDTSLSDPVRIRLQAGGSGQTVCLHPETGYTERRPGDASCGA
ncbi:N-terminal methylation site-containing protein [Thiohalospira halophila DSM 15071]|uniref:N-terminal methylation site-containing protein n=1 Tax=Thiohalospira halophila DSM 15071 TaxID=1123397 RepID=A0A1I1NJ25_9GAMM|nr:prepilin-type N-terminal cleavage/methylation domain-containing protein [Thiohalospira halophila]SFC93740.1 N-terminal methylation site-containing protein [Thiohalospira halophila DSM 15071]